MESIRVKIIKVKLNQILKKFRTAEDTQGHEEVIEEIKKVLPT